MSPAWAWGGPATRGAAPPRRDGPDIGAVAAIDAEHDVVGARAGLANTKTSSWAERKNEPMPPAPLFHTHRLMRSRLLAAPAASISPIWRQSIHIYCRPPGRVAAQALASALVRNGAKPARSSPDPMTNSRWRPEPETWPRMGTSWGASWMPIAAVSRAISAAWEALSSASPHSRRCSSRIQTSPSRDTGGPAGSSSADGSGSAPIPAPSSSSPSARGGRPA